MFDLTRSLISIMNERLDRSVIPSHIAKRGRSKTALPFSSSHHQPYNTFRPSTAVGAQQRYDVDERKSSYKLGKSKSVVDDFDPPYKNQIRTKFSRISEPRSKTDMDLPINVKNKSTTALTNQTEITTKPNPCHDIDALTLQLEQLASDFELGLEACENTSELSFGDSDSISDFEMSLESFTSMSNTKHSPEIAFNAMSTSCRREKLQENTRSPSLFISQPLKTISSDEESVHTISDTVVEDKRSELGRFKHNEIMIADTVVEDNSLELGNVKHNEIILNEPEPLGWKYYPPPTQCDYSEERSIQQMSNSPDLPEDSKVKLRIQPELEGTSGCRTTNPRLFQNPFFTIKANSSLSKNLESNRRFNRKPTQSSTSNFSERKPHRSVKKGCSEIFVRLSQPKSYNIPSECNIDACREYKTTDSVIRKRLMTRKRRVSMSSRMKLPTPSPPAPPCSVLGEVDDRATPSLEDVRGRGVDWTRPQRLAHDRATPSLEDVRGRGEDWARLQRLAQPRVQAVPVQVSSPSCEGRDFKIVNQTPKKRDSRPSSSSYDTLINEEPSDTDSPANWRINVSDNSQEGQGDAVSSKHCKGQGTKVSPKKCEGQSSGVPYSGHDELGNKDSTHSYERKDSQGRSCEGSSPCKDARCKKATSLNDFDRCKRDFCISDGDSPKYSADKMVHADGFSNRSDSFDEERGRTETVVPRTTMSELTRDALQTYFASFAEHHNGPRLDKYRKARSIENIIKRQLYHPSVLQVRSLTIVPSGGDSNACCSSFVHKDDAQVSLHHMFLPIEIRGLKDCDGLALSPFGGTRVASARRLGTRRQANLGKHQRARSAHELRKPPPVLDAFTMTDSDYIDFNCAESMIDHTFKSCVQSFVHVKDTENTEDPSIAFKRLKAYDSNYNLFRKTVNRVRSESYCERNGIALPTEPEKLKSFFAIQGSKVNQKYWDPSKSYLSVEH